MRGKRRNSREAGFDIIILLAVLLSSSGLLNWFSGQQAIIFLALGIGLCYLVFSPTSPWVRARRFRALGMDEVDNMPGLLFEEYVAKLLEHQGYNTRVTPASGDLGVDIVAQKGNVRYAVQCKRHHGGVSRRAVSDAVAGKSYYECNEAMVVTNNYYTTGALELARSNHCILVDRNELAQWANSYRGTSNTRADKIAYAVFAVAACVILVGLVSGLISYSHSQSQAATATAANAQGINHAQSAGQAGSHIIVTIYADVPSSPSPVALTATPTPTMDAPNVVIAAGDTPVIVRSVPSAGSTSMGMLNPGDVVSITAKSSDGLWWQITYKGQAGWVSSSVAPVRGDTNAVGTVLPPTSATQTPASGQ